MGWISRPGRLTASLCALLGLLTLAAARSGAQLKFSPPVNIPVGVNVDYPLVVDLDGDGKLDIVVVTGSYAIMVLYGHGDGTFDAPIQYPLASVPEEVIAVDVNGDGRLDLVDAVQGNGTVAVLLSQGNRTFAPPVYYQVGPKPYGIVAGDFNEDGHIDLATSNNGSNNISVLINNGDGTFAPAVNYGCGAYPGRIKAADFDHDGHLDLVSACYYGGTPVYVYHGDGHGNFTLSDQLLAGSGAEQTLVADFNQDGNIDIATMNAWDSSISVMLSNGNGTFIPTTTYPAGGLPDYGTVYDMNGDGYPDLVTPNSTHSMVTVLLNLRDGTFDGGHTFATNTSDNRALAVGDLNGDGLPDIITSDTNNGVIVILFNQTPTELARIEISPGSVLGSKTADGTVILNQTRTSATRVTLTSDNSAAPVATHVTVPAGALSATFRVHTIAVSADTTAHIRASYGGITATAALEIRPFIIQSLTVAPAAVAGGGIAIGTVLLDGPAPAEGATVKISSSDSAVALGDPIFVTVGPGGTTTTFNIPTAKVLVRKTVTVKAVWNGHARDAQLTIRP